MYLLTPLYVETSGGILSQFVVVGVVVVYSLCACYRYHCVAAGARCVLWLAVFYFA